MRAVELKVPKAFFVGGTIAMLPTYQYASKTYIEDAPLDELLSLVFDMSCEAFYDEETDTKRYIFDDLSQLTLVNVNQTEGPCEIKCTEVCDEFAQANSSERAHA